MSIASVSHATDIQLTPLLGCLIDIIDKLTNLRSPSNEDLYQALEHLRDDVEQLACHFCSHAKAQPEVLRLADDQDRTPHARVFISQWMRGLVKDVLALHKGDGEELIYTSEDIRNIMYDSNCFDPLHTSPAQDDTLVEAQLWRNWQDKRDHGPSSTEIRRFFHDLRNKGFFHLSEGVQCLCDRSLKQLYHDTVQLSLMLRRLRLANSEYDLSDLPRMQNMRDVHTKTLVPGERHCVIPALQVKRGRGEWVTISPGYGTYLPKPPDHVAWL